MADPITISAVMTAASTAYGAVSSYQSMNAQADADQARSKTEAEWAARRANDERAAGQRAEGEELRKAEMAKSRLGAVAGASGSGSSDASVMNLYEGIENEGAANAGQVRAGAEQKATGIEYQSALDRWTADSNAEIKRSGAKATLIGGLLGAGGQGFGGYGKSRMALKYGSGDVGATGSTGYGR